MYALVDCNNFYASCEQLFHPYFRCVPIVVLSSNDGCVIARCDKAKKLGIPMGAPAYQYESLFLEHNVQKLSSNFALYGDMSRRVVETLKTFHLPLEVYSIDEAFLVLPEPSTDLGQAIQKQVTQWTGIPISIGIGPSKTLAKVANRLSKKRNELTFFSSGKQAETSLKKYPVEEVWGIGSRKKKRLHAYGIITAYDLIMQSDAWIKKHLSITGLKTVWELRGTPCLECEELLSEKKSITSSRSFGTPLNTLLELQEAISSFTARAAYRMRKQKLQAHALTVFIQKNRFEQASYSFSASSLMPLPTSYTPDLIKVAHHLLATLFEEKASYKKAGVLLSELISEKVIQTDLFSSDSKKKKKQALMQTYDAINTRFENCPLSFACEGLSKAWQAKSAYRSPHYTTSWDQLPIVKAF